MDAVRGTVFFNVVEILRVKRPRFVILENVAHFVRHDDGNTYARVKAALESLGYAVMSTTLSPHWFGVPQIRERMYLVGRLHGLEGFKWPSTPTRGKELSVREVLDSNPSEAKHLSSQVTSCLEAWQAFLDLIPADTKLPSFPMWSMETRATYPYECDSLMGIPLSVLRRKRGCFGTTLNKRLRDDILQLVPSYARGAKGAFPRWKQGFIEQNRGFFGCHAERLKSWVKIIRQFPPSLQKFEWNCQGGKRNVWEYVIQFRASGVRVKRPTTSPSLVAMTTTQVPIVGWERRYMTVRECARLQSMEGLQVLPDGEAAMEALGNAVNVKVASAVMESLLRLG
jgi:DNA (cytosine-5)-methyltransferase 1